MSHDLETLLGSAMHEQAAGLPPAPDLLSRAAGANRQARSQRWIAVAGVGALAIGAGLFVWAPTRAPAGVAAPAPEGSTGTGTPASPMLRLAAAITNTEGHSFRLHLRNTVTGPRFHNVQADYTGSYDPVQRVGGGINTLGGPCGPKDTEQVRLFAGQYYVSLDGLTWMRARGALVDALVLDGGRRWGPSDVTSAEPQTLLRNATDLGTVTAAGSASGLDRYAFRYRLPGDDSVSAHEVTGTIAVHHDSNLVATLEYTTTVIGPQPAVADGDAITFRTRVDYSDYDVPVAVAVPTGTVVEGVAPADKGDNAGNPGPTMPAGAPKAAGSAVAAPTTLAPPQSGRTTDPSCRS